MDNINDIKTDWDFVKEMHSGMRVKTPSGNGVIETIIEDIHCHVNVILDNGEHKNFMLYEFTDDNKLKLNLNYELL